MKQDSNKTKVIFRKIEGEVTAIFPDQITDNQAACLSYAILGQHSACSPTWIKDGGVPTIDECAELINELQGLGYNLLFEKGEQS